MQQSRDRASRTKASRAIAVVALFSGVVNLLGFIGPLFMLETYDRVTRNGGRFKKTMIVALALGGIVAMSG